MAGGGVAAVIAGRQNCSQIENLLFSPGSSAFTVEEESAGRAALVEAPVSEMRIRPKLDSCVLIPHFMSSWLRERKVSTEHQPVWNNKSAVSLTILSHVRAASTHSTLISCTTLTSSGESFQLQPRSPTESLQSKSRLYLNHVFLPLWDRYCGL